MLPKSIENLIEEFSRLPGVGPKTAARLTFYLLTKADSDVEKLSQAIGDLKSTLIKCQKCYNIAESSPCKICDDLSRDQKTVCVAEEPLDVVALEKTGYRGIYHVLGGVISPIDGIGPENLHIKELYGRLKDDISEIILATNPSLEGEATAIYLVRQIENLKKESKINQKIKVTRIARGLPIGGDLEYADEVTLRRAIEGRREY